jgi:hypothetical protein
MHRVHSHHCLYRGWPVALGLGSKVTEILGYIYIHLYVQCREYYTHTLTWQLGDMLVAVVGGTRVRGTERLGDELSD